MEKAPKTYLETLDGETIELLEEYKGKPLLIIFFNIKCLGCTSRGIPLAYDYMNEFKGLSVIGIHSNFNNKNIGKQDILDIFTTKILPFPIYFDKENKAYDDFHCEGTPHWILINRNGEIYRSVFGSQWGAQNRLPYALADLVG